MSKMYRSSRDKKLFGLCGGLAEAMGVDATLIRILLIVLAVFSGGTVIPIYILAAFVVPKAPYYGGFNGNGFGPGPNGPYYDHGYGQQHHQGYNNGYNNPPYGGAGANNGPYGNPSGNRQYNAGNNANQFDSMMEDLERKALRKEVEELKSKLAKYEKGDF
ncbi:PspC domain-containing protein [Paenibacillus sp. PR3]|uniref:PspC domain-containing protein n=1 Tax=Paenibacillus terricola TaxID=2763503 RepID=A0ABR8MM93_9BACL|nr:PspC domain-containing protein [Paenibacillus terricola]MBD3917142.1 PspC domain-containing protein [Paenibacillus terricola]